MGCSVNQCRGKCMYHSGFNLNPGERGLSSGEVRASWRHRPEGTDPGQTDNLRGRGLDD